MADKQLAFFPCYRLFRAHCRPAHALHVRQPIAVPKLARLGDVEDLPVCVSACVISLLGRLTARLIIVDLVHARLERRDDLVEGTESITVLLAAGVRLIKRDNRVVPAVSFPLATRPLVPGTHRMYRICGSGDPSHVMTCATKLVLNGTILDE